MNPGDVYEHPYPFVREKYTFIDEEGVHETTGWRPGVQYDNDRFGGTIVIAHGTGKQILTVVSIHKPGCHYPERVFYVQQWETPEGKVFGKRSLKITTTQAFKGKLHGYRYPADIQMEKPEE